MDGFAIRAADVADATDDAPVRLTVVGESRAGGAPDARVMPETAIRIATGAPPCRRAPTPSSRSRTRRRSTSRAAPGRAAARCWVRCPRRRSCMPAFGTGNAIRPLGSDVRAGDVIAQPGDLVTPAVVALASGAGVGRRRRAPSADRRGPRDRATRCARPARTSGLPGSRTRTVRGCVRSSATRARSRSTSGSPSTPSRTSRRGSGAASPRPTSSSCRAASRSGRTTSSGSRSTTWGT